MIQRQVYKTWGNYLDDFNTPFPNDQNLQVLNQADDQDQQELFFRQVCCRMIVKRIIGYLKLLDWEHLETKTIKYSWSGQGDEELDGITILWILMQICNPSTRIGVSELKEELRSSSSAKFNHDIQKLTDYMSSKYCEIKEKDQSHEDMILDLINAFKTVPNHDFAAHVQDKRKQWELGGEKDVDQIISEALVIYNNVVTANCWQTIDPKDAKIIALTTQVEKLVEMQTKLAAHATNGLQYNNSRSTSRFQSNEIADWRMKKSPKQMKKMGNLALVPTSQD